MLVLAILLILASLWAAGWGYLNLTAATHGVGLIGLACFYAILARLVQADIHQRAHLKKLEQQSTQPSMPIDQPMAISPRKPTESPAPGHKPGKKRCPHCHVFIPADASECPYCNKFVK